MYDLGELYERLRLYGASVLGFLLASSLIAFLLSSRLQSVIATPISRLADVTTSVSESRDYSIRAEKLSGDELGVLVDAFNQMLESIQSRDIELRKALLAREGALKEAQSARDSLRTTLASIGDAVISTDVDGCIVFANRVAQSLLKWPAADMERKHLDDVFRIVSDGSRKRLESPVTKVLREGAVVGFSDTTLLIARDGTETPIEHSGAPIRSENGAVEGTVLVFRDSTERRRAEETSRLLALIVESSDDAIIGKNLNGIVTSWNKGAERIYGYTREEMIDRPISTLSDPNDLDEVRATLERIGRGERVDQHHAVRVTKDGRSIHVSETVSPLPDSLGRAIGASIIARDITEQVRAADQLAQLNADLLRSNENLARSNEDLERFAFVASHDLQEPLRMISIYSQLLVRSYPPELDVKARGYVNNIVESTKRIRELLADLLAYTEIGAHTDKPAEAIDLNVVVDKVKANLKAPVDESGAVITADRLPALQVYEAHFIPLFQNLIGNAIKYRSQKPPRIHISFEEADGHLRFAVADNGIGIAPEYHHKIFGAFKRLHGKNIPGTGIGLAICKRIVERYGGRVWVQSEVGEGSTFHFTLPDAREEKKQ
jgi:PAS domain S-box-containing protein